MILEIGTIEVVTGPKGTDGIDGVDGVNGTNGVDGNPGPNQVTTSTDTNITGLLKGNGSKVAQAEAGADYVAPVVGKSLSTNDYNNTEKANLLFLTPLTGQVLNVTDGQAIINMARNEIYYETYNVNGALTITITGLGSSTITMTANGIDTPVIVGATKDPRSDDYDTVNLHRNRFIFWADEEATWYSITKLD